MEQAVLSNELQKFNVTDAAIAKLSAEYLPLKIAGLKDTEGYKKVHEARMVVKGKRVEVEKKGKELRADAVAYSKAVIEEERRIVSLLTPIEDYLHAEEKKIDDEKERIKKEIEEKEKQRIQARVNVLFDYGCRFDGTAYSIHGIVISQALVKSATDDDFFALCNSIQVKVDEEAAKAAEIEEKRKEEEARLAKIAAEQEAERQRLAAAAKAQAEQEEKAKAEQEAERKRIAAEQEAIEREKREIQAQKDREEAEKKRQAELEAAQKVAAEKAKAEEAERIHKEAEAKAEAARLAKIEAERQEALRPDKDKLLAFADAIETVKCPEVSKDAQAILAEAKTNLTKVANIIRKKTREM